MDNISMKPVNIAPNQAVFIDIVCIENKWRAEFFHCIHTANVDTNLYIAIQKIEDLRADKKEIIVQAVEEFLVENFLVPNCLQDRDRPTLPTPEPKHPPER